MVRYLQVISSIVVAAVSALCWASTLAGAPIPLDQVPPAPEPPSVVYPAEGGAVVQANDSITFTPHDGSLQYLFIARSPETTDQRFGRPPSANPELADQIAIIFAGGPGATRVPLRNWPHALPPGRYWFNALWTFDRSYEVCIVTLADGSCAPWATSGLWRVQAVRFTAPQSFVIAPPPATSGPGPPPSVTPARSGPRWPAACAGYRHAVRTNALLLRRWRKRLADATDQSARNRASTKVRHLTRTRVRLVELRDEACRVA